MICDDIYLEGIIGASATILLFWEIGRRVNNEVLDNKRAYYGKRIVVTVTTINRKI
jgi:hypothetical protein